MFLARKFKHGRQKHERDFTVWYFHDFSITQILREINVGDSKSAISANLTHLEALTFDFYDFWHFLEFEIHQINKMKSPKNGQNSSFRPSRLSKFDFT